MTKPTFLVMVVFLVACDAEIHAPDPSVSFAVQVEGDIDTRLFGKAFVYRTARGYTVEDATGARQHADVTSLELRLPGHDVLQIALLGEPQIGTYHVQDNAVLEGLEFYGGYALRQADHSYVTYEFTGGTVQVVAIQPIIKATFVLQSRTKGRYPIEPAPGTVVHSEPANLKVSGEVY